MNMYLKFTSQITSIYTIEAQNAHQLTVYYNFRAMSSPLNSLFERWDRDRIIHEEKINST